MNPVKFLGQMMAFISNPFGAAFKPRGYFTFQAINPDGSIAWTEVVKNGNTTVGLNYVLGTAFNSVSQITSWFMGLVDNAGFSAFSAGDTSASHAGWTENQDYSESTRPQWTPLSVSGGSITNTSVVAFSINNTIVIKGAFMISNSTKGGTTGTLWATGAFSSTQSLSAGQTLNVTYTCPGS